MRAGDQHDSANRRFVVYGCFCSLGFVDCSTPAPDPDADALDLSHLPDAPRRPARPGFPRPEGSAQDEVNF